MDLQKAFILIAICWILPQTANGFDTLSARGFFQDYALTSTTTEKGNVPAFDTAAVTESTSFWSQVVFNTATPQDTTEVVWEIGSSTSGISLTYAGLTIQASVCVSGVPITVSHSLSLADLEQELEVIVAIDMRTYMVSNPVLRLFVNGQEKLSSPIGALSSWSDDDVGGLMQAGGNTVCATASPSDLLSGQVNMDVGFNTYVGAVFFNKHVTGDFFFLKRPIISIGAVPTYRFREPGIEHTGLTQDDVASFDDKSFVFQMSAQFYAHSSGNTEVLADIGGATKGIGLYYINKDGRNTIYLALCAGNFRGFDPFRSGAGYSIPDYLLSTPEAGGPFLDLVVVRDTLRDYTLFVNGEKVAVLAVYDEILGSNPIGLGDEAGKGCAGPSDVDLSGRQLFTSGVLDVTMGLAFWGATHLTIDQTSDSAIQACSSNGIVTTSTETSFAKCLCFPGFSGERCGVEDDRTLATSCFDSEAELQTGPARIRTQPAQEPRSLFCDMDAWGGGNTICGKFDRDNSRNKRFLADGFGRANTAAAGLSDLDSIDQFNALEYQASHDCRELLHGRQKAVFMHAGTDDFLATGFEQVYFTSITGDIMQNATHLFDVNGKLDTITESSVTCDENSIQIYSDQGQDISGTPIFNSRAALNGVGAGWVNYGREGAVYSASALSGCTDVGVSPLFWGFEDQNSDGPEYDCTDSIGTFCGSESTDAPQYRYNVLFIKAALAINDQIAKKLGSESFSLHNIGGLSLPSAVIPSESTTIEVHVNLLRTIVKDNELLFSFGSTTGVAVYLKPSQFIAIGVCSSGIFTEHTARLLEEDISGGFKSIAITLAVDSAAGSVSGKVFVDYRPAIEFDMAGTSAWADSVAGLYADPSSEQTPFCSGAIALSAVSAARAHVLLGVRGWRNQLFTNQDRCAVLTAPCDNSATCTLGYYDPPVCVCPSGLEGADCSLDINECKRADLNDCDKYATCTNFFRSYSCQCLSGFEGDGTICVDVMPPTIVSCPQNMQITQATAVWTSPQFVDNSDEQLDIACSHSPGEFDFGVTDVECVATDVTGNSATCSFSITRIDVEGPQFSGCPTDTLIYGTEQGDNTRDLDYAMPTAQDTRLGSVPVTCDPPLRTTVPIGDHTVTCSATDGEFTSLCVFQVRIEDFEPPRMICPNDVEVMAEAGFNTSTAAVFSPVPFGFDNVDEFIVNVTCDATEETAFEIGSTDVTCSCRDSAGNRAFCSFVVTVVDVDAPRIKCPKNGLSFVTDANQPTRSVELLDYVSARDNDGVASIGCLPDTQPILSIGSHVISCRAADTFGNSDSCSFNVEVLDVEDPTITCAADLTLSTEEGEPSAIVNFGFPVVSDNSKEIGQVQCTPARGSRFDIGSTTVYCSAADVSDNTADCSFNVTVVDTESPVLTCPGSITNATLPGRPVGQVLFDATAVDNSGTEPTVACSTESPAMFGIGMHSIVCTAADAAMNEESCGFTVTVVDDEPPSILCERGSPLLVEQGKLSTVAVWDHIAASDNSGEEPVIQCSIPSGSDLPLGVHEVSCTATDASQNTATCQFVATVQSLSGPVLTCPDPVSVFTAPGLPYSQVAWGSVSGTNELGQPVAADCLPASNSFFQLGESFVTCQGLDSKNRTGFCSFRVTVTDNEKPSLLCPTKLVIENAPRMNYGIVSFPQNLTAVDNSNVQPQVVCNPEAGAKLPIGTHSVKCEATDGSGNTRTCPIEINVMDTEAPNITCPASVSTTAVHGQATAVVIVEEPQVADNSGSVRVRCNATSGLFPLGSTPVGCTASDAAGNSAGCAFTVMVADVEPPQLTCPASVILTAPHDLLNITRGDLALSLVSRTTSPNERRQTAAYEVQVGPSASASTSTSSSPYGMLEVFAFDKQQRLASFGCVFSNLTTIARGSGTALVGECSATDGSGNHASCSFMVALEVNGVNNLQCTAPAMQAAQRGFLKAAVNPTLSVIAPASTTPTSGIFCSVEDGTELAVGNHEVLCSTEQTILVNTTAALLSNRTVSGSGSLLTAVSFCILPFSVVELEQPIIQCPESRAVLLAASPLIGSVQPVLAWPEMNDNHVIVAAACNKDTFAEFTWGHHTVSCEAEDFSGNTATCSYNITVLDEDGPVLDCPAVIESNVQRLTEPFISVRIGAITARDNTGLEMVLSDSSGSSFTTTVTRAMSSDNVPTRARISCNVPSDGMYAIETATPITCEAYDEAGNTGSCSFDVVVGVDCLGQWTDWACQACPSRTATRQFEVNVFPVLSGRPCPSEQTQECEDAEPCFRVTADLTIGPVSSVERALGDTRQALTDFLSATVPIALSRAGAEITTDQFTITGLRGSGTAGRRRRRADGEAAPSSSSGFIVVAFLIDGERSAAKELVSRLESRDVQSALQQPDALATFTTGSPEDLLADVETVAISEVFQEPVLPLQSTTNADTTMVPTLKPSSSSDSAGVAVIAGAVAAAMLIIIIVIVVVSARIRNKTGPEPIVLSRRVDESGAQSFKRSDGTLRGRKQTRPTLGDISNPLYGSFDGAEVRTTMFANVPVGSDDEGENENGDDNYLYDEMAVTQGATGEGTEFLHDESVYKSARAKAKKTPARGEMSQRGGTDDSLSYEYAGQESEDESAEEDDQASEGFGFQSGMSSLLGIQNDPMLAGLMDGLMSSEKMITQRKLEIMERKNQELEEQLAQFHEQDELDGIGE